MTPSQTYLYWREWQAVRIIKPDADRHALHLRALGRDKSSKDFTNADLDKVLAEFRAVSDPANLDAQLRIYDQSKRRLIWSIRHEAPAAYVERICLDRFKTTDLGALGTSELNQLRNTIKARANRLRRLARQPERVEPAEA